MKKRADKTAGLEAEAFEASWRSAVTLFFPKNVSIEVVYIYKLYTFVHRLMVAGILSAVRRHNKLTFILVIALFLYKSEVKPMG